MSWFAGYFQRDSLALHLNCEIQSGRNADQELNAVTLDGSETVGADFDRIRGRRQL